MRAGRWARAARSCRSMTWAPAGLSNALPELVNDSGRGGRFELRAIPNDDPGMSPLQVWCNESQERYVLAIDGERLAEFQAICERERCPCAVLGEATDEPRLVLGDGYFDNTPIDLPMNLLLGKPPKLLRDVRRHPFEKPEFSTRGLDAREAAYRVLRLPGVAGKTFLITIGDRSIGGMVSRDQMVGPWQVPVADVAVTVSDYQGYTGEAMAMGERAPIALVHGPASGRMAVGEAITNIAAGRIDGLGQVRLSANWMAAAGHHRRGCRFVRHGKGGRRGALPGAGDRHPRRQGFPVHEERLEGRRGRAGGHRALVGDRFRVRPGRWMCAAR